MRILVKELFKADPNNLHDYEVKDVVFDDVKTIEQNPIGGLNIITESGEYVNILSSNYHYIQIF